MEPITRMIKRKKLGINQFIIAAKLECSVAAVSFMETGNGRISTELIKRYESLLRELEAAKK